MPFLKSVLLGLTALAVAVLAASAWWVMRPLTLEQPLVSMEIELGQSPKAVAKAWTQAGVDAPALALYAWFRVSGQATKIRAGSYELRPGISPWSLLFLMVQGSQSYASVRLGEGWNLRQVRAQLAQAAALQAASTGLSDQDLLNAVGADPALADGAFFPDTYYYAKGSKDMDVLRRASKLMQRRLQAVWEARAPNLPLQTPQQLAVLASMVEKESGVPADRSRIAAVFTNRLRLGMPLQSDPTVIYGMGEAFDGNLRHDDLLRDTTFNTYTRKGLPPNPIATVSLDSLQAAAHPAMSDALYFVARGDGSSEFSSSLQAHNQAVNRYQRHRVKP